MNTTLYTKLAAVMGAARNLPRSGRNNFDRYDFITSDDVVSRIGELLAKQNVAFLPSLVDVERLPVETKSGSSQNHATVLMQMTFACGDTGETTTCLWRGEATDRSDKSISKAVTSAVKYFLLKTFLVAGGESDPDAESNDAPNPTPAYTTWQSPEDAYKWATDYLPEQEARAHFAHIVATVGNGKLNKQNVATIYRAFYQAILQGAKP